MAEFRIFVHSFVSRLFYFPTIEYNVFSRGLKNRALVTTFHVNLILSRFSNLTQIFCKLSYLLTHLINYNNRQSRSFVFTKLSKPRNLWNRNVQKSSLQKYCSNENQQGTAFSAWFCVTLINIAVHCYYEWKIS